VGGAIDDEFNQLKWRAADIDHQHASTRAGGGRAWRLPLTASRPHVDSIEVTGQNATLTHYDTTRDTRCYFNVRSKADMSQLNLPHGTNN